MSVFKDKDDRLWREAGLCEERRNVPREAGTFLRPTNHN